jgi:CDP-6-deoxy-D-xylo-4-hexulose-3-dehydrase
MGEGGAVFTQDGITKRALESIRDWGRDCYCEPGVDNTCKRRFQWKLGDLPQGYDHKYTYSNIGYNLKITDMQAAVGLSQMDRLEDFIAARRRNFDLLTAGIKDLEDIFILPVATKNSNPSWFGFPITLREGGSEKRDALIRHLESHKIATRLLFGGNLLKQPYMKNRQYRLPGDVPNSDIVMNSCFWVGVYPGLTEAQLSFIIDKLKDFYGR